MIESIRVSSIPNYFSKFSGIKYLRSLLRHYSYSPSADAWKSEDEQVFSLVKGGIGFLDGDRDDPQITEMLSKFPDVCYLVVRQDDKNDVWQEILNPRWKSVTPDKRWAFSSETLDVKKIRNEQPDIPNKFTLKKLGNEDYIYLDDEMGRVANLIYGTTDNLFERATSFGLIDDEADILVSLCTGFPLLENKDEIDIVTRDDEKYRRKGFGSITSRALMVHSLENNRIPEWDAANEKSMKMAKKLGFSNPVEYYTYICKN